MLILKTFIKALLNIGQFIVILMTIGILGYLYLLRPFQIKGLSMYPTFDDKEYLLTNLLAYRNTFPEYGDIVVFQAPNHEEFDYIKRVIGLPGDTVEVKKGKILVNGAQIDESFYLKESIKTLPGQFMAEGVEITVPKDEYFLAGDNRPGSSDSRDYGPVPMRKIYGKVWVRVWPLSSSGVIKHTPQAN